MNIVLAPGGTYGDVRPMIALALKLKEENHNVKFVTGINFQSIIEKYGIYYKTDNINYQTFFEQFKTVDLKSKEGKEKSKAWIDEFISNQFNSLFQEAKGADLIIGSGVQMANQSIAEVYKIPSYHVIPSPSFVQSKYHPPLGIKYQNLPPIINLLLWKIRNTIANKIYLHSFNRNRENVGLKPVKDINTNYNNQKFVLGYPRELATIPKDHKIDYCQIDVWHLEESEELPDNLMDFIENGEPPIYFGFGSLSVPFKNKIDNLLTSISVDLKVRFIVQKGWGNIDYKSKDKNILLIDSVPHSKLFPKVKAVIHHGGGGTTVSAALAGVPQIIIPIDVDQYYQANQVFKKNIGPKPVDKFKIEKQLKRAVSSILKNTTYSENAKLLSNKLQYSKGLDEVINFLNINNCS
jgi:UDP:flavonoid glycosyltransferase YjiC (YdhE family)